MKYTDPSGHNPDCGPDGVLCDGDISNDMTYYVGDEDLIDVDIIGFKPAEEVAIWIAILTIAENLSRVTGYFPWDVFKLIFGGITISAKADLGGYYGLHSGNSVKLLSGQVTSELVAHEMGHVFEKRVYNALGKDVSKAPANMLASIGTSIKDELGTHVTGVNGGNFERTMLGYVRTRGLLGSYHPVEMMPDGDGPYEDFADMFMNWTFNSFDYTDGAYGAGTARYNWIDVNMSTWISYLP